MIREIRYLISYLFGAEDTAKLAVADWLTMQLDDCSRPSEMEEILVELDKKLVEYRFRPLHLSLRCRGVRRIPSITIIEPSGKEYYIFPTFDPLTNERLGVMRLLKTKIMTLTLAALGKEW